MDGIQSDRSDPRDEEHDLPVQRWRKRHRYTFGIALVLLGVLFLLKFTGLIEFTWPLILLVIGSAILVETWLNHRSGGVFPGILLCLLALIFVADNNQWVAGGVTRNWPFVVLAVGLSFLISAPFVQAQRKNWIPGVIVLAAGGFFLLSEYEWIQWGVVSEVLKWWPSVLIIVGIWYLFHNPSHLVGKRKTAV